MLQNNKSNGRAILMPVDTGESALSKQNTSAETKGNRNNKPHDHRATAFHFFISTRGAAWSLDAVDDAPATAALELDDDSDIRMWEQCAGRRLDESS